MLFYIDMILVFIVQYNKFSIAVTASAGKMNFAISQIITT